MLCPSEFPKTSHIEKFRIHVFPFLDQRENVKLINFLSQFFHSIKNRMVDENLGLERFTKNNPDHLTSIPSTFCSGALPCHYVSVPGATKKERLNKLFKRQFFGAPGTLYFFWGGGLL